MDFSGTIANGTFASIPQVLAGQRGLWMVIQNAGATDHTLTASPVGKTPAAPPYSLNAGQSIPLASWLFSSYTLDAADGSVLWTLVERDALPPFAPSNPRASQPVTSTPTPPTLQDHQAFDGSINAATADAVSQAGANPLPVGALVYCRLTCGNNGLATASSFLTYVDLVGNTTGVIYAKAWAGQSGGGDVSVSFRMPVSEKLDIHTRNQDSAAHGFSAAWEAWAGI